MIGIVRSLWEELDHRLHSRMHGLFGLGPRLCGATGEGKGTEHDDAGRGENSSSSHGPMLANARPFVFPSRAPVREAAEDVCHEVDVFACVQAPRRYGEAMMPKRDLGLAGVLAIVLALTGCGFPSSQAYSELSSPQTPADVLTGSAAADSGVDKESTRQVGSRDGIVYYLGVFKKTGVCIFVVQADEPETTRSSCSAGRGGTIGGEGIGQAKYVASRLSDADLADLGPNWEQLSDNLVVTSDDPR